MIIVHYLRDDVPLDTRQNLRAASYSASQSFVELVREALKTHYEPVAKISIGDVRRCDGYVYEIMQNGVVTPSWVLDPPKGLTPMVEPHEHDGKVYGWRSMDVCDVIEYNDGIYAIVAPIGFIEFAKV